MKKRLIIVVLIMIVLISTTAVANNTAKFYDVSSKSGYYNAVQFAVAKGIMDGYTDEFKSEFKPDEYVTRAELAEIIEKMYNDIQSSEENFIPKIPKLLDNSVIVSCDNSYGSGVALNNRTILTASHVATNDEVNISTYHNESIKGKVIKRDADLDLALIQIDKNDKFENIELSKEATDGQSILVIGNPSGLNFTLQKGIISNLSRYVSSNGIKSYIQISASINAGNSGGGVFDKNGDLVGIVLRKAEENNMEGIGYAIGYYQIKPFLEEDK
jgi:serine protease Do